MKTSIFKIFILYWVVMLGVDLTSDLIGPLQMRRYPPLRDAIHSAMMLSSQQQVDAYEAHGCGGYKQNPLRSGDVLYIADTNGRILCVNPGIPGLDVLAAKVRGSHRVLAHRFDTFQVVGTSMNGRSGREYVLFLKNFYPTKMPFLNWMFPGPTTVAVSCTIALVFAIFLTLPLRRLRRATNEMAAGNLDVRVPLRKRMIFSGRKVMEDDLDRLTRDFNGMAERLQGLVEAQHLLLRDVSHELRSPLARLNVALALSRREGGGPAEPHLDRIEREANKLNDLIARLLSLSYMETTQNLGNATTFSLGDIVRGVLPNVEYEASLRGCQIATTLRQNCVVRGDSGLLESALENILRNALRYTPENGTIEVNLTETTSDHRRQAELCISDRGPGVPADELDAILRPFYRVDNARQSKTGGFGLGLAIANRAVRLHGGSIVAANRPDGGLAVRMLFPVA
jgi:two-component system sensor histidine kinase CpxA